MSNDVDRHVTAVANMMKERAAVGMAKYGVNLERQDLSVLEWLQHLQEELCDAANYVEVLKDKERRGIPEVKVAKAVKLIQVFNLSDMPFKLVEEFSSRFETSNGSYHKFYPNNKQTGFHREMTEWLTTNGMVYEDGPFFYVLIYVIW